MQYKGGQIHPFCAEPDGGYAVTFCEVSDSYPHRKMRLAAHGRRRAEGQVLPYSHSPSVQSVAGNG